MMMDAYTPDEQAVLLQLARQTLEAVTAGQDAPDLDYNELSPRLCEERACFVTMRRRFDGALRGCTGTLVARRPLALEVIETTIQTAFYDPRFRPVLASEVPGLHLEISILTPPIRLEFTDPDDLLTKLRPGIDGVTLMLDARRATFLPQVWESYPDPRIFLSLLCEKMGSPPDAWKNPRLKVERYQAVIMEEAE
jgi:AmmeMemoRadiSam system protein A